MMTESDLSLLREMVRGHEDDMRYFRPDGQFADADIYGWHEKRRAVLIRVLAVLPTSCSDVEVEAAGQLTVIDCPTCGGESWACSDPMHPCGCGARLWDHDASGRCPQPEAGDDA